VKKPVAYRGIIFILSDSTPRLLKSYFIIVDHRKVGMMGDIMKRLYLVSFINIFLSYLILHAESGVGESASGFLTSLPPEAPVLDSPADASGDIGNTITLKWLSQIHTSSYNLQISESADFNDLAVNATELDSISYTFDGLVENTAYYWRVSANNVAGTGSFSPVWHFSTAAAVAVDQADNSVPQKFALLPAYPNPFNPVTSITFHLPENSEISLIVLNTRGQVMREIVHDYRKAGKYTVRWDGRDRRHVDAPSGMYICLLKTENRFFIQKMLLMR
jgi:hypothetical protein